MYTEKYRELLSKPHPFLKMYVQAGLLGVLIFSLFSWYLYLTGGYDYWLIANQAMAETAVVMIGLSFSLSGICYFWDFADRYIIYRKYLGLVGWGLILFHGIYSFANYMLEFLEESGGGGKVLEIVHGHDHVTQAFDFYFVWDVLGLQVSNVVAFSFGVLGLLIFTMMAAISNSWATRKLGGGLWRVLLRVGYLGYIFGILHVGIKRMVEWKFWLVSLEPVLPPLSLLTVSFAIFVLGLRLALQVSLWRKGGQVEDETPINTISG